MSDQQKKSVEYEDLGKAAYEGYMSHPETRALLSAFDESVAPFESLQENTQNAWNLAADAAIKAFLTQKPYEPV